MNPTTFFFSSVEGASTGGIVKRQQVDKDNFQTVRPEAAGPQLADSQTLHQVHHYDIPSHGSRRAPPLLFSGGMCKIISHELK